MVRIPVIPAIQSSAKLPPNPVQSCHLQSERSDAVLCMGNLMSFFLSRVVYIVPPSSCECIRFDGRSLMKRSPHARTHVPQVIIRLQLLVDLVHRLFVTLENPIDRSV